MGAFIFSVRRSPLYRNQPWTRSLIGQLLFWIAVNIAIGYSLPFIDNTAHVGGLIAGLILGPDSPPRSAAPAKGERDRRGDVRESRSSDVGSFHQQPHDGDGSPCDRPRPKRLRRYVSAQDQT